jgi:hypothetical protein
MASRYNRAKYEPEKRAALDLWAKHIAEVVAVPTGPSASATSKPMGKALAPAEAEA